MERERRHNGVPPRPATRSARSRLPRWPHRLPLFAAASTALLMILTFWQAPARARSPARIAVITGHARLHQQAADALLGELREAGHDVREFRAPGPDADQTGFARRLREFQPAVIATSGAKATVHGLEAVKHVPVVFFMLPNVHDAPFLAPRYVGRKRIAGVSSDVAPADLIAWTRTTRPGLRTLAVPFSTHTARTAEELVEAGAAQGLRIRTFPARRDAFPELINELNSASADGVLMIPDAGVYNSANVQRLLLWGVRSDTPVWTFSEKVVKAGAFSGQSVDARAVGRQASTLVERILRGEAPESVGIHYTAAPIRSVNLHTLSMLDAVIAPDDLPKDVQVFGDRK